MHGNHILIEKAAILHGDITQIPVDAVVNAAASSLQGGGGVDGAIHKQGGPAVLAECKAIVAGKGNCQSGEAVISIAGNLPAKRIIHTVGPIWHRAREQAPDLLAACYRNSLRLAVNNRLVTVSFPNISTGVYGYPKEEAARIAIESVRQSLLDWPVLEKVFFVCCDRENYRLYVREIIGADRQLLGEILKYRDFLTEGEEQDYFRLTQGAGLDPYIYNENVLGFFDACSKAGLIQVYDWKTFNARAKAIVDDPQLLRQCDIVDLVRLLTLHHRTDRFVSGHMADMLMRRHLARVVDRIAELTENLL